MQWSWGSYFIGVASGLVPLVLSAGYLLYLFVQGWNSD